MEAKICLRSQIVQVKKLMSNPIRLIKRRVRLDAAKALHRKSIAKGFSLTTIDLEEAGSIVLQEKRPTGKLKSRQGSYETPSRLSLTTWAPQTKSMPSLSATLAISKNPSLMLTDYKKSRSRLSDVFQNDFANTLGPRPKRNVSSDSFEKLSVLIKDCSKIKEKTKSLGEVLAHTQLHTRLKDQRRKQIVRDLLSKLYRPKSKTKARTKLKYNFGL